MARFDNVSDVSFIGDITLADLKKQAIDTYNKTIKEITGKSVGISDENKAILYAAAQIFFQLAENLDEKAKQNLLKYATGDYLDNLALGKGLTRKEAERAVVTIRFTLSAARSVVTAIPAGTRVTTAAGNVYFATDEYTEIAAGALFADILCTATEGGSAANDIVAGELVVLVDPIAYIGSVTNAAAPTGGADTESDDDFAERIFAARNLYSTAGSENAYKYFVKEYSSLIDDVYVANPQDAEIEIYILMADRELATAAFLEALEDHINNSDIRPLTDSVTVDNATRVNYTINASYKVYNTDLSRLADIQTAVAAAVESYKAWQSERIGRDINPQKLISMMIAAGAAQVTITTPAAATVEADEIAYCTTTKAEYTGYITE